MTLFCKEERKVSLKYYSGFQEIRYGKSLENDTMTLSSGKKYTCYVLQDVMTDLGLLQNNNVRNHPLAAMCNCTICYIAREQHIDALPCEIQNGNGSVGGWNRLFTS